MRSGIWIILDSAVTAILSLFTVLALARLISPEDFIIGGIITGTTLLVNLFVEGLFHDALIQESETDDRYFSSALFVVETLAVAIFLVGCAVAFLLPYDFVHSVSWMVVASLAALPFSGFVGIVNARERRALRYQSVAVASIVSKLVCCALSIWLAFLGFGAWAIVAQLSAGYALQAILLAAQTRWLPPLAYPTRDFMRLLRYAIPNVGVQAISFGRVQAFSYMLVWFSGLSVAGYLNVAFRLTNTPQIAVTWALMNFAFPLLSQAKHSSDELRRVFELATKVICATAVPAFVGMAVVADVLVPIAFGPEWEPIIVPTQVLSLGAAAGFIRLSGSLLLRANGNVMTSFLNSIFQFVLIGGLMIFLRPDSAIVAACIWIAPLALILPATFFTTSRDGFLSPLRQLAIIWPSLAGIAVMVAVVEGLKTVVGTSIFDLALLCLLGAISFGLTLGCLDWRFFREVWRRGRTGSPPETLGA